MLVFSNNLNILTFTILLHYTESQFLPGITNFTILLYDGALFAVRPEGLNMSRLGRVVIHFERLTFINSIKFFTPSATKKDYKDIKGLCTEALAASHVSGSGALNLTTNYVTIDRTCTQLYIRARLRSDIKVYAHQLRIENYLGCFSRLSPANKTMFDNPDQCRQSCLNSKTKYYAVEIEGSKTSCVCENSLLKYRPVGLNECSGVCPINWRYCGIDSRASIFSTGNVKFYVMMNQSYDCLYDHTTRCKPCPDGREGFYCERINCTYNSCGNKMRCETVSIQSWEYGACVCIDGYYLDEHQNCVDIDECVEHLHTCETEVSTCVNKDPFFECLCKPGYAGPSCPDVDECLEAKCDNSTSRCINAMGSYSCECLGGYKPIDGVKCKDIDECAENTEICDTRYEICVNKVPGFHCLCKPGYVKDSSLVHCLDVDECRDALNCDSETTRCANTPGSFECLCLPGYDVDDGHKCKDIDECSQNKCNSISTSCHNIPGSFGCKCLSGFSNYFNYSCTDDDECIDEKCDNVTTTCRNQPGSFVCECLDGYSYLSQFKCKDVDECEKNECDYKSTICYNTIGSFECRCLFGFSNLEGLRCQDNNECADSTHDCESTTTSCSNTDGSYVCMCNSGFTRLSSTKCQDRDECLLLIHDCGKKANCENTIGSYTCNCPHGTEKFTYQYLVECQDIDECRESESCDISTSVCINMIPGFVCMCLPGFSSIDNFTCIRSVPKGTLTTSNDDYPNHKTKMTQDATQWTTDENENYDFNKLPILILIVLLILSYAAWFFFFQIRRSISTQLSMSTAASEYSYDTSSND